ncbi:hypothetical protein [Radiobacillus sp. PE A8.2]|uniref:hypothetical protein n=1 Tax=Radiobacillus sp. PE A8.2 TaxID=3380349 RepID=UPI00388EAE10
MSIPNLITYKQIDQIEDIDKVVELQASIWSREIVSPQPQLIASIHHGGIVMGAFVEEMLVGFCYGFAGFKDGESYLISHMTGILPSYQNSGIGYQLKIKQREWAINLGYKKIVWTYDPLEIRNGYFNMSKLGAYSKRYIPSYYGELNDKLNKGLPSDRLLIEWDICSKRVEDAIFNLKKDHINVEAKTLLHCDQRNEYPSPELIDMKLEQNYQRYRVPVPTNIQFLKQRNPDLAKAWRYALRTTLSEALSSGYSITGVQKQHHSNIHFYILENSTVEG